MQQEPTNCKRLYMLSYPRSYALIAFKLYRWDINLHMSTIIDLTSGRGIGFLPQQNINQLNYQAASALKLAIEIVVARMKNLNSMLRE